MPKMRVEDVEINYYLDDFRDPWNDQKPQVVLMHHGFARNAKFWTSWVPTLARKCRVLRYDARGCGESTFPGEDYPLTMERLAADGLGLMDKLGIDKVHWVGMLSGGLVGQMFAVLYPERIKSLTLIYSPCTVGGLGPVLGAGHGDTPTAIEKLGIREWRTRTVGASMDLSKADPRLVEWTINEMSKTPKRVALALTQSYRKSDMTGRLAEIKAPTLILLGDRSRIISPDMLRTMRERIQNSRLRVFPNISDGIDLIMPDRCAEEALAFITEVD